MLGRSAVLCDDGTRTPTTRGTVDSFGEIYRVHLARIYRFCLSQLRDPSDAEDVTSETVVRKLFEQVEVP